MSWFSSKVSVTFVDDATGEAFGQVELEPAELPETFALNTTMHLGDEDWSVVAAEPLQRVEFVATKQLTLRLRKVEQIDPSQILYSLPTICDEVPPLGETHLTGDELALSEDDWRQIEFVSQTHEAEIADELAEIRWIHEEDRAESGWRTIRIRCGPQTPLNQPIALSDLCDELTLSQRPSGVAYHGSDFQVANGFAFEASNELYFYGVAVGRRASVLAIHASATAAIGEEVAEQLTEFARSRQLVLIDWCRFNCAYPEGDEFARLLNGLHD